MDAVLQKAIDDAGARVRELKAAGRGNADPEVAAAVAELKALKAQAPLVAVAAAEVEKLELEGKGKVRLGDLRRSRSVQAPLTVCATPAHPAALQSRADVKAERLAARTGKAAVVAEEDDPLAAHYGDAPLVQSAGISGRVWTRLGELSPALVGQRVLVRGRVHTLRGKGKSAFLVLRQQTHTLQVVFFVDEASVSKGMVKYVCALTKESVVDVEGTVTVPEAALTGASVPVELQGCVVHAVSRAAPDLPFQLEDAGRSDAELDAPDSPFPRVGADTRLDNRVLDLRTPANHAIFRLQSAVGALFREALAARDFVEIHTPKLIAGASEGGASVFKLSYMGTPACLAQSPQLYKQARGAGGGATWLRRAGR